MDQRVEAIPRHRAFDRLGSLACPSNPRAVLRPARLDGGIALAQPVGFLEGHARRVRIQTALEEHEAEH